MQNVQRSPPNLRPRRGIPIPRPTSPIVTLPPSSSNTVPDMGETNAVAPVALSNQTQQNDLMQIILQLQQNQLRAEIDRQHAEEERRRNEDERNKFLLRQIKYYWRRLTAVETNKTTQIHYSTMPRRDITTMPKDQRQAAKTACVKATPVRVKRQT